MLTAPVRNGNRLFWPAIIFLGLALLIVPLPGSASAPVERYFRVEASRFAYSPSILRVNPGDRVTIDLVATDVVHGLAVDGYSVETTGDPGRTARLSFIANRGGSFRLRCTAICGPMHPFMIGELQVGRNELLWRASAFALVAIFIGIRVNRR